MLTKIEEATANPQRSLIEPIMDAWGRFFAMPAVQDGVVAVALAAVSLVGLVANLDVDLLEGEGEIFRHLDAFGVVLVIFQTIPLRLRRVAPVWILSVTGTALLLFSILHYHPSLGSFGFVMAVYTIAAYRERPISVLAGIASAAVVLAILLIGRQPVSPDTIVADYLIVGAAWFLGEGLRLRRDHVVRLEDRAARLEREREERAQQAVAQERRVIARELHDVVAHHVSVIVAQAGAAQRIFDSEPGDALASLGAIESMGREALVEMRRLMGFLRTESDKPTRDPQPGLRNLDGLIAQVREAGVRATLKFEGIPRPLPAGLDLSAFRIVQEGLTNILKHAESARAEVLVRYAASSLEISIQDDGSGIPLRASNDLPTGYGQLGMRERVALFGGELRLGPSPGGGYQVNVSLPLYAQAAEAP